MKNVWLIILFCFNSVLFASSEIELSKEEKAFLREHPVIKVSSEAFWEPYDFEIDGVPKGYSTEYLQLLSHKLGITLKFVYSKDWSVLWKKFCNKEVDVIHVLDAYHKDYKCGIYLEDAYISESVAFASRSDFKPVNDVKDLFGYKVALYKDVEIVKWFLDNYGDKVTPVFVDSPLEGMRAVAEHRADVFPELHSVLHYHTNKYGFHDIKTEGYFKEIGIYALFIGVRNDWPLFAQMLQKARNALTPQELQTLRKRWLMDSADNQILHIALSNEEKAFVQKHKLLTLGGGESFEPFLIQGKSGAISGYDADIVHLISQISGLEITFKLGKWGTMRQKAEQGEIDGLISAVKSKEDINLVYTDPYIRLTPLVIVKRGNPKNIFTKSDLAGKSASVQSGNLLFNDLVRKHSPTSPILFVESLPKAVAAVVEGRADYTVLDETAFYFAREMGMEKLIETPFSIGEPFDVRFALRKELAPLANVFNRALAHIPKEKKLAVKNRWFGDIKVTEGFDTTLLWKAAAGVLIIVLFLLLRYWQMKRVNRMLQTKIAQALEREHVQQTLLFQQNKLAAMGDMIGTIAHQWRQPLSKLSMGYTILQRKADKHMLSNDDVAEEIKDAQETLQFMSRTIETFQNFYRGDEHSGRFCVAQAYYDVKTILQDAIDFAQIRLDETIDESAYVTGSQNQLSQVMLAIMQNSIGFFELREIEKPHICVTVEKSNGVVVCSFSDNAGGVAREELEQIMEYNYSKREGKEKSTGIGLYVSRLIIKEKFHGTITALNCKEGLKIDITILEG